MALPKRKQQQDFDYEKWKNDQRAYYLVFFLLGFTCGYLYLKFRMMGV